MIQLHTLSRRLDISAVKPAQLQPPRGNQRPAVTSSPPTSTGDSVHFGSFNRRHCTPTLQRIFNDSLVSEAANGNAARVGNLLASHADINHANMYHGKTALMMAAENEKTDVLNVLIRNKANLEKVDYDHRTALILAARSGKVESLRTLLNAGARRTASDRQGMNALLLATNCNRKEAMEFLLDEGFNIESRNYLGRTPLQMATERGHTELMKILISRGANLGSRSFEETTPLMLAAREGRLQAARVLIEAGADLNARNHFGMTPLMLAARSSHMDVAKLLLEHGADVRPISNDDETAIFFAASRPDLVRKMMENGADPGRGNRRGVTPLMEAVRLGSEGSVEAMLEQPYAVNINRTDRGGYSALNYATDRGAREGIIKMLLQVPEIDVESRDQHGNTPLILAARRGSFKAAQALVEHGANVNAVNLRQTSALHLACGHGNLAMVKYLLEKGANPNRANVDGATPMFLALKGPHMQVVDRLLQHEGHSQPRPHTQSHFQFQNHLNTLTHTLSLDRTKPFHQTLPMLVRTDHFKLTELLYMGQEQKPLSTLPYFADGEMNTIIDSSRHFGNAKDPDLRKAQKEARDQAWRNLEFLARHKVDMQPAMLSFALAQKHRIEQKKATKEQNRTKNEVAQPEASPPDS